MPIVEWNDTYSVGVEQFDQHHKRLIGLINELHDSFAGGSSEAAVESVLEELIDYATYHFTAEEFWMEKNDYALSDAHNREHIYFTWRVMEIQRDLVSGKAGLTLDVLAFLKMWLTNHILSADADYGRFAAGQRPGTADSPGGKEGGTR